MKTLIIGFLVLSGWSALSTYIYVCKIKGFCNERETTEISAVNPKEIISMDSLIKTPELKVVPVPKELIVYFEFDKSEFKSDEKSDTYYSETNSYLNQNLKSRLNITGYTDAVGSDDYNQSLGYRRAQSLQKYFESKGISPEKILIESKGEKEPAEDNSTPSGRANNRRTTITIKN
jgi:outer membrane protein OmpA-like peptidoglycan-associated protein